jgi:hypothetical protein
MTRPQRHVLQAVRLVRRAGKPATECRVATCAKLHPSTVALHLEKLEFDGYIAEAAFLLDTPRGYRLTGKGKAALDG